MIGRRRYATFGNSIGDREMLCWQIDSTKLTRAI
jgi:hypothetical protein